METLDQNQTIRRKRIVNIEASLEWIEWVDGLAESVGLSRSATIDQALRRLAMHLRYKSLPPKR